ncbi:zinc finger CCCH domain-containing protein 11A isoform X2 [Diabrotica virgifera virgifera]|nr:zinc finger CCCH domain-containing protein 11A isoform X2 [Diabrotica virgifera virgifera]
MTDLDSPKKNNDCYFYYYSTCSKGDSCIFRHEPSALGCETMCSFWKEGKCFNIQCNFRHMELRKNRKAIPCYWESQPGGCLKGHCSFLHQNPRPVDAVNRSYLSTAESVGNLNNSERNVTVGEDLVVNFEEESDNESMPTYSPAKHKERICTVKSLEEIRLEKIQAESAAYYSYSDDSFQYDGQANMMRERIFSRMQNKLPTERTVVIPKRQNDSQFVPTLPKKRRLVFHNEDGNLEIRINKGKNKLMPKTNSIHKLERTIENHLYRQTNHKKSLPVNTETNLEDIKIKTLDEIRRERKTKEETVVTSNDENEVTSTCMDVDCQSIEKPSLQESTDTSSKKIVLKRLPIIIDTPQNVVLSDGNESTNNNLVVKRLPIIDTPQNVVLSDSNKSTNNNVVSSNVSRLSESKVTQKQCETESASSKLEETLLMEEDDLDDDTVMLKAEEELLNEVDDEWED